MNKKILIGIIVAVVLIAIAGGSVAIYILNRPKIEPETFWQKYVSLINEQKYEEMYEMLTQESKEQIAKEDFVKRNKNIYDGIGMNDMKTEILAVEEESSSINKISFNLAMNTDAGDIKFDGEVRLTKAKEKGYLINWSSSLIFPQLSSTDKVKVKTISSQRGEILDQNGKMLAG